MKKKIYEKPTMTVVELQHRACLLQATGTPSNTPPEDVQEFDGMLGYAPGKGKDGNYSA